jgi:hypothetical protein
MNHRGTEYAERRGKKRKKEFISMVRDLRIKI